jgi:hypothetical protein
LRHVAINGCEKFMSAIRSLTLTLTLACLVRTAAASDLVYVEQAASSNVVAGNQLVLVQQANFETPISAQPTTTQPLAATKTAPLKSKFLRFGQKQLPIRQSGVSTTDQTRLMQPNRVAAGMASGTEAQLTNPRAQQVNDMAKTDQAAKGKSNSFMDRLRQLSTGTAVTKSETAPVEVVEKSDPTRIATFKKPESAPAAVAKRADLASVVQVAVHEEPKNQAKGQLEGLVYVEDSTCKSSSQRSSKKPEVVLTQAYSEQLEHALSALPAVDAIEVTAEEPENAPLRHPIPEPAKIVFRPAVVDVNGNGQPVLRPDVYVANQEVTPPPAPGPNQGTPGGMEELSATAEPVVPEEWSAPIVDGAYEQYMSHAAPRLGPMQELCCRVGARLNGPCGCEPGLGTERVMHAISFVDTTQPMQNFRMRFDAGYDYQSPDRAEYFWAQINGRGPAGDRGPTVDYQDIRTYMEVGGDKFSVGTDVPIRIVDPTEPFGNHSGIGDINITTKTLFLDGKFWQIANLFRTHIPSGNPAVGLGTGHASIEPGFAIRYKWSDYTYFHGDLKYWVPLGGNPAFEGEVLNYGIAMSHVWRETDSTAIMPTIELRGYSFLNGQETSAVPNAGGVGIDPEGILIVHPGVRWAWDHGTDCGLREVGLFGGFSATSDSLYEELIRLEFRWMW